MRLRAHHCTNFAEKFVQSVKNSERPAPRRGTILNGFRYRVAAPSIRSVPWAALASCWPLPQQLLPVSAAGGGRRRCTLAMFSGIIILYFAFVALCGALQTHFHRRGRRGKRQFAAPLSAKARRCGEKFLLAFSRLISCSSRFAQREQLPFPTVSFLCEKGISERPQTLRNSETINNPSLNYAQSNAERI